MADIAQQLAEPFPASEIEWRAGAVAKNGTSAMALAYLTARAVQNRLDEVFGVGNWSSYHRREGNAWVCRLVVRHEEFSCEHEDVSPESDIEGAKGGVSGSLKRAAVRLGIGRYLYYLSSEWVAYDAKRKRLDHTPALPAWALPGGSGRPETVEPPPAEHFDSNVFDGSVAAEPEKSWDEGVTAESRKEWHGPYEEEFLTDSEIAAIKTWQDELMPKGGPTKAVWKKSHDAPPRWSWAMMGGPNGERDGGLKWAIGAIEKDLQENPEGRYVKHNRTVLHRCEMARRAIAHLAKEPSK